MEEELHVARTSYLICAICPNYWNKNVTKTGMS